MKILHLCLCGQYNEYLSYQDNLIPKYHKIFGHEVTVIAPTLMHSPKENKEILVSPVEKLLDNGIKLIRLPYRFPLKFAKKFRTYKNLKKTLEKEMPDFVFVHGVQFLEIFTLIKFLKKNKNIKVVADNHTDYHNSASNWLSLYILHGKIWRFCAKKLEKFCAKYYGVTPVRCDFLNKVYNIPKEKIDLLPLGADDFRIKEINKPNLKKQFRAKLGINENDFVITTGGKIDEFKRIDILLEAFKKIDSENRNLKIIYFGNIEETLKIKFESFSENKNIIYLGWQNTDEINEIFLSSDLAIFPGSHSVLWEQAIATGLPCVFRYIEGMHHVNVNDNCVFLRTEEEQELINVIDKITLDNEYYWELKNRSLTAKNFFSYSDISKKIFTSIK